MVLQVRTRSFILIFMLADIADPDAEPTRPAFDVAHLKILV